MENLPNSRTCFVCGDRNLAGLGVRFRTDGEAVYATATPRVEHTGYNDIVHGGVLAALMDETMGWAPALANRRFCVCVEITVRYEKPVRIGSEITAVGRVTSAHRRIWEAEGEIRDASGAVCVRGKGRYMPVSDERTREVVDYLRFDDDCVPRERICRE